MPKTTGRDNAEARASRRAFLKKAAAGAAGAAVAAAPAIHAAEAPIVLRFQSTWATKDIVHEYALDFAKKVNEMSGGRLKIEMLPSGSIVKAFDLLDAVAKGTLDGGHGVIAYWYPKNSAIALWGSGPAFGMDPNMVLAWHHYGGGKDLLDEIYRSIHMDVKSFVYGPMPTQPLGWFKKPVTKPDDFKGMKYRTAGLSIDIFTALGADVHPLPSNEIVPAMDRGVLDAAEFNNPSSDKALGFADVAKFCMLQSWHQPAENLEILVNRKRYDALPQDLRAIVGYAVEAASADMSWKAIDRYSKDFLDLQKNRGVKFIKTPDSVLKRQLEVWDEIAAKKSAENPMFKKVLDSMRAFAERAGRWQAETNVDYKMAINRYFPAARKKV